MTSDTRSGGADPPDAPQESVPAGTTDRIVELREEVDQLKEAVTSHATVDQAIGMMVALGRVSPTRAGPCSRKSHSTRTSSCARSRE